MYNPVYEEQQSGLCNVQSNNRVLWSGLCNRQHSSGVWCCIFFGGAANKTSRRHSRIQKAGCLISKMIAATKRGGLYRYSHCPPPALSAPAPARLHRLPALRTCSRSSALFLPSHYRHCFSSQPNRKGVLRPALRLTGQSDLRYRFQIGQEENQEDISEY